MKIGYLGPKATFSHEAATEYCKKDAEIEKQLVEFKTIQETIIALAEDKIEEAVVPIENSLQGCVTDAIDTLIQNEDIEVQVVSEILLEIKQNLMANVKCDLKDIEVVYSHPQAIAQCSAFIEKYLKNATVVPVESTAGAAKKVSIENSKKIACIGNIACLKEYNLHLIKESIQDNNANKTRFWILGKIQKENSNKKKMSMIFSVKDRPGALYNVLEIFNKYNLNLTKIESRPAKTVLGEYIFWIDVSLDNDKNENVAIKEIKDKGIYVRILGKY